MFKFQDERTRNSLFSILSESEDKINLLGELSKIDELEKLINAGKEKQKEEARKNQHIEYIKKVGIEIQNLIENQLNKDLNDTFELAESTTDNRLQTREEQNGQDFIIYKRDIHTNIEEPVYFIEVKSRWDIEGIVALSKRQIEKCAKNPERYAVITVNVADYKSKNNLSDENITFELLKDDIYVNTDLSFEFQELIKENEKNESIPDNTKLIEYRGHIPQTRIKGDKSSSISFKNFIENLKTILS